MNIYVGNQSYDMTDDDLQGLIEKHGKSGSVFFCASMALSAILDFFLARDGGPEATASGLKAGSISGRTIELDCSCEQAAAIMAAIPAYYDREEGYYSRWVIPECPERAKLIDALRRPEFRAAHARAWRAAAGSLPGWRQYAARDAGLAACLAADVAAILGVYRDTQMPIRATGWAGSTRFLSETFGRTFRPQWRAEAGTAAAASIILAADHGAWLRASYARNQNPLPGLRRRAGGTWEFARPGVEFPPAAAPAGEISIPGLGRVRWTPAQ